jgi:hypothetical protein
MEHINYQPPAGHLILTAPPPVGGEPKLRCPLDEREATNLWRFLFTGKEVTDDSLEKAEAMLDEMSGESPLHLRLSKELAELRKLRPK